MGKRFRKEVNNRDDFTEATKRALATRVAYICSNPACGAATAGPNSQPTKMIMVGVAAHITSAAPDGKRYNPALTREERRYADNGIWLCQTCGKRVDDDDVTYPEALLREWKRNAEARAFVNIGKTAPFGVIDSLEILNALSIHIPDEDIHLVLGESLRRLSTFHGVDHLAVKTTTDGLAFEVGSSEAGAPQPQNIRLTPVFPDTEEGTARKSAWDEFIRLGTPVEIFASDIPVNQLPPQVKAFANKYGDDFRLRLGPSGKSRPIIVSMRVEGEAGLEYTFPYLDFRVVSGGIEKVTLSNAEQPIPFKFELTLTPTGQSGIHWTFEITAAPIFWFVEFLRFNRVIASLAKATVTILENGLESVAMITRAPDVQPLDEQLLDRAERVLAIQRRLGLPLRIPTRTFFDEADVMTIQWFEHVLKTGRQPAPPIEFRMTAFDPESRTAIERYEGGPLRVRMPRHSERLLDNDVDLGAAWISCECVHVAVAKEPIEGEPYAAVFIIVPAPGLSLDVIFERFTPESVPQH